MKDGVVLLLRNLLMEAMMALALQPQSYLFTSPLPDNDFGTSLIGDSTVLQSAGAHHNVLHVS